MSMKNTNVTELQDPLYIDRSIKEELIDEEWNEIPYCQDFNYYSEIEHVDNNTAEADLKLEEKYRITIVPTKSKNKPSYKYLIRLYCKRCKSNSEQDFQNDYSKSFTCEKKNCREPLSFQCITCDNCYKHLPSAYRHVRYNCKGLKNVIKTEIKTEHDSRTFNTKVYNPYVCKNQQSTIKSKKNNCYLECSKCDKVYKSIKSLYAPTKLCGIEKNIKCEFCPFKNKYAWSVRQHTANLHVKKEKDYKVCHSMKKSRSKYINRFKKRKRIRKLKKTGISKWFCCEHCNYEAYRKDHPVIHMQRNHSKIYPLNSFTCKLCKKDCRDFYAFNSHMKSKCICRNARVILSDIKV
ncbi:transcriptional repressor CTCF-like [Phymastichus coffea]|uniref:transcriptional repressor CTCF-like n=1 Tax=Phymastichus coffea TaxID=108790 RepID=UPI00273B03E0|nr:transcriptional repressor CTCF-like [Phymastichus coffea]